MENICTKTYFSSIFLSTSRVASLACTSYITGASRFEKRSKYLKSKYFSVSKYKGVSKLQPKITSFSTAKTDKNKTNILKCVFLNKYVLWNIKLNICI